MKLSFIIPLMILAAWQSSMAQDNVTITGQVLDAKTRLPLINASIGLKRKPFTTTSDAGGKFGLILPLNVFADTLLISYVGYKTYAEKFSKVDTVHAVFLLNEDPTMLDEVVILEKKLKKFEIRRLEVFLKPVNRNLYAFSTEVTNDAYDQFLSYLLQSGQKTLYSKYKPDYADYSGSLKSFFTAYHADASESGRSTNQNYDEFPVVNISYEAAVAYCEWLSDLYNNSTAKKKFREVKFRLPALREWQVAALGNKKFTSWNIEENDVEVMISVNPDAEVGGKKKIIPVKGNDILYPWYGVYAYRNKAQNIFHCWLGNFKIPPGSTTCHTFWPGEDGFPITGRVGSYFPNGMGLYDVSGNVAEMIDEKGKACGGSWDQGPEDATILSISDYSGSSGSVGFRVFMDVITEK